jgi:hypothetical protein
MNKEHKRWLESIRRSGSINMFGAAPYLKEAFGLKIEEARSILGEWMRTYDPNDPDYAGL